MAPQLPEHVLFEAEVTEKEIEVERDEFDHIEQRTLNFNIVNIYNDIKNIEWSKVVWRNVILFVLLHIYSVYGIYIALVHATWKTLAFSYVLYFLSGLGITMGAHRLWSHRSFKANFPLRVFLAFCQTLAFQNDIYDWARDHRTHHKYSETDADPHNARRGFFFSHMGWLLTRKHPLVIEKGQKLDLSDVINDPVVRFQRKFYVPLVVTTCFVMPSYVPWKFWGEDFVTALMVSGFFRYTFVLHATWLVNSLAHYVGVKPFDRNIFPAQNSIVAYFALGEGWHNYHHVFPWDYRTSEFGALINYNVTTFMIDLFSKIGWATQLKVVDPDTIQKRILRTGDGTHSISKKKVN